jgi:hypothetical protein
MHAGSVDHLTRLHVFLGTQHNRNERRAWFVADLTFSMMVAEITGGTLFGSFALIADGALGARFRGHDKKSSIPYANCCNEVPAISRSLFDGEPSCLG